ncbi:MAG: hypothetical protein WCA54_09585 [Pseudolabrys sp.]
MERRAIEKALDECPINHENVDFYKEIATKPHLFPNQYSGWSGWFAGCKYKFLYWTIGKLWMTPHLLAFLIILVIVYLFVLTDPHPMK